MSSLGRLKIESEKDLGSNRHGNERKRILQYNERRHMAMRSTSKHQRIITDHIGKPSVLQTRGQSITTTTDYPLPNRNGTSLPNDTVAIAPDRRSIAMGIRSRSDRSGGFSKSLKTKASKLLRREANSTDLTPLRAVDWSEELDESPYEPHATQSTSPQHNLRHKHRGSLSDGMQIPLLLQMSTVTYAAPNRNSHPFADFRTFQLPASNAYRTQGVRENAGGTKRRLCVKVFCNACITSSQARTSRH